MTIKEAMVGINLDEFIPGRKVRVSSPARMDQGRRGEINRITKGHRGDDLIYVEVFLYATATQPASAGVFRDTTAASRRG